MNKLSDQLTALSARAKKTEDTIGAARDKNRSKLEAQRTQLKASTAVVNQLAKKQAADVKAEANDKWAAARNAVAAPFANMHDRVDEHRAEHDVKRAQKHADVAEQDAADAIDLALYCLDMAEYAIVDAVVARADADQMSTSSPSR